MAGKNSSRKNKTRLAENNKVSKEKSDNNTFWVVLIGGLLTLVGVVTTAYFGYESSKAPFEIPLQATQTVEAKLTALALVTLTPTPTVVRKGSATNTKPVTVVTSISPFQ